MTRPIKQQAASELVEASISPWAYIMTMYIPLGIISSGLLVTLPSTLFKLVGWSNEAIGLMTGLGLVSSLRFMFAPWLDGAATKRRLTYLAVVLGGVGAVAVGAVTYAQLGHVAFLWSMVALLFIMAVVSASLETGADGFYIRALDAKRQAEFIGIKTAAIRAGVVFSSVVLLLIATKIAASYGATDVKSANKTGFYVGFAAAFAAAGAAMIAFAIYNKVRIPKIPQDQRVRHTRFALGEVLREYARQPGVLLMILAILLYRFGEGFLGVMKTPFFLDSLSKGGLHVAATEIPYYTMLAGLPFMILGGIISGYLIKWFSLKRMFIPLALLMSLPNLFYVWLAAAQPQESFPLFGETLNTALMVADTIESLGYGMSFSAIYYYMHIMATESGRNKTSILAVSLAVMNVGWIVPGMLSGFVQAWIGYTGVFLVSSSVGLSVLLVIPFLPMPQSDRPLVSRTSNTDQAQDTAPCIVES